MKSKSLLALAAVSIAAVSAGAAAPAAHAAAACSYKAGTQTVTVSLPSGNTTTNDRFGQGIRVDGALCGAARITNTTAIDVNGASGTADENVSIKLAGGQFVNGATEIPFTINLAGTSGHNLVRIVGSDAADNVAAGTTSGNDLINLNAGTSSTADVTASGDNSLQFVGGTGSDIFTGQGGAGTGTATATPIDIIGGPGNDDLSGGNGDDTIDPGNGADTVNGEGGNDSMLASGGNDSYDGGTGTTNTFDAGGETAAVKVNLGTGTATGASIGSDTLANIDKVRGTRFADVINGGSGNDDLVGFLGSDVINGGAGNDIINGGGGADTLSGGAGDDTINGFGGNDTIIASTGNDTIDGGSVKTETNTIDYSQLAISTPGPGVTVNLIAGTDTKPGGGGSDTLNDITNVVGTAGDDTIVGSNHQSTLIGGAGNDTITGGSGKDTIDPGTGTNTVDGGKGIDTITFASAAAGVHVSLRNNLATGTNIDDSLIHIENIRGSKFADVLIGDAKANVINPGAGNDTVNGESGDDIIVASSTADGADNINGGAGVDTMTYAARHGNLHISLNKKANDGAKGEHDFIHKDVENVIGGSGNDTISGDSANNVLNGGPGKNTLSVAGAPSAVAVNLTTHVSKHWGTDTITHFQNVVGSPNNDTIIGNSLANVLNGAAGNDTIRGMAGPDFLIGGPGNDHLNGGTGNDRCSGGGGSNVLTSC